MMPHIAVAVKTCTADIAPSATNKLSVRAFAEVCGTNGSGLALDSSGIYAASATCVLYKLLAKRNRWYC